MTKKDLPENFTVRDSTLDRLTEAEKEQKAKNAELEAQTAAHEKDERAAKENARLALLEQEKIVKENKKILLDIAANKEARENSQQEKVYSNLELKILKKQVAEKTTSSKKTITKLNEDQSKAQKKLDKIVKKQTEETESFEAEKKEIAEELRLLVVDIGSAEIIKDVQSFIDQNKEVQKKIEIGKGKISELNSSILEKKKELVDIDVEGQKVKKIKLTEEVNTLKKKKGELKEENEKLGEDLKEKDAEISKKAKGLKGLAGVKFNLRSDQDEISRIFKILGLSQRSIL